MREINSHKVNPANDRLTIKVLDEPSQGGACHQYEVSGFDAYGLDGLPPQYLKLPFQNGPINEGSGVNGLTHEVLIAIIIDRLEGFQSGKYACRENALALTKLQEAQHWLHHRTRARTDRGVEGTHAV